MMKLSANVIRVYFKHKYNAGSILSLSFNMQAAIYARGLYYLEILASYIIIFKIEKRNPLSDIRCSMSNDTTIIGRRLKR